LLSVPFLLLVVVLLTVEVGVRLLLPTLPFLEFLVTSPDQLDGMTDARQVRVFEGDARLFWKLSPNLEDVIWDYTRFSTNSEGIRYRGEIGSKRAGGVRILCLGDSVTFGYRVPTVWAERPDDFDPAALPYPMLLEDWLRAANPGRPIEVIGLAVPGYTSHQGLAWLRRDIERLEPDLVTANFGWNDANVRAVSDRQALAANELTVLARRTVGHSQALMHLVRFLRSLRSPARPQNLTHRVPRAEFVENFVEMAHLSRQHGADFVALGTVYRDAVTFPEEAARIAENRAALRERFADDMLAYFEIPELTEAGAASNQMLFGEIIHPNHLGHLRMAQGFLEQMEQRGFLGRFELSTGRE
jgi:lysophospholipase L1-like esterase